MSKLILIKHSLPEITPDLSPAYWPLSDIGRLRCSKLAERVAAYTPDLIVTSLEPKAIETGQIIAGILDKPCETAAGLHEHDRSSNAPFTTKEEFEARLAAFFEYPQDLIFGTETADQTHSRYAKALTGVIESHPAMNLAVVSHGTVMTLFITRLAGLDPFPFWQRLGLPSLMVLSLPGYRLLTDIENITE
jgi:broad specificity phosphatase PhoE